MLEYTYLQEYTLAFIGVDFQGLRPLQRSQWKVSNQVSHQKVSKQHNISRCQQQLAITSNNQQQLETTCRCCQILLDIVRSCQILLDIVRFFRFCQILLNIIRSQILLDIVIFCQILLDMVGYFQILSENNQLSVNSHCHILLDII